MWWIRPLALVLVLSCMGCMNSQYSPQSSSRPLSLATRELLLDATAFPEGWRADPCDTSCDRAEGDDYAYRSFGVPGIAGHVNQDVNRYETETNARAEFQRSLDTDFQKSSRLPSSRFVPPSEISYSSPIADQSYLGCGVDVISACRASIRYGNYFIHLFFVLDDVNTRQKDGLNLVEVQLVLRAMDEQVVERFNLSRSLLEETPSDIDLKDEPSPTPPATLAGLMQALSSDDSEVRSTAAYALGGKGTEARAAVPDLMNALADGVVDVRLAAVWALGNIGASAKPATTELTALLFSEESEYVRMEVASALGRIGERAAVPALANALEDPSPVVARHAAESLMLLTKEDFHYGGNDVDVFDDAGRLWSVRLAQEWWIQQGQYESWPELP